MKLKTKTRIKLSVAVYIAIAIVVNFAFWLSGYDFDVRGEKAVADLIVCIILGGIGVAIVNLVIEEFTNP